MNDLNYKTLQNALERLPEYDPPETVWDELSDTLDADAALGEAARALPDYDPPALVWTNIEADLGQTAGPAKRPLRRVFLLRRMAAAAAVAGLLLAAWWMIRPAQMPAETIAVTQEIVDEQVFAAAQEPEDEAFELIRDLCRGSAPVCREPGFLALKNELDELTNAKNELREALGQYGNDPDMTMKLVRIERERSHLLRQMIRMI